MGPQRDSRRTRVLHVIDTLALGGAQRVVYDTCRTLQRDYAGEFDVEVAALHRPGPTKTDLERLGVTVHMIARSRFDPRLAWRLSRLIRSGRYDIVHAHLVPSSFLCEWLVRRPTNTRLVCHLHNLYRHHDEGYQKFLERLLYRRVDAAVACSQSVADNLPPRPAVVVIPNGIDADRFTPPTSEQKAAAKAAFHCPPGQCVVGFAGRLAPIKQPLLLLEAFNRASQQCDALHLLIAGDGPLRETAEACVRENGLQARVTFAGAVDDMPTFFHALDAFALPSENEGLPIALLEAMASGLPCVATDFAAAHEVLHPPNCGLVVGQRDADALAGAFVRLAAEPEYRLSLGQSARDRVENEFRLEIMVGRLAKLYRDMG